MKCYSLTDASIEEKYELPHEVIIATRKRLEEIRRLFLQECRRLHQAGQSEESILQALEPRRIEFKIKPKLVVQWCQEAKNGLAQTIVEKPPSLPKKQSPILTATPISSEGPVVKEQAPLEPARPDPVVPEVISTSPPLRQPRRSPFPLPARVRWYIYPPMGITVILLGFFFTYNDRQLLTKEQDAQEKMARFEQDFQRWDNLAQRLRAKDYVGVLKSPLPQDKRLVKKPQQWISQAQAEDRKATQQLQQAEKIRKKGDVVASLKQLKQIPKNTTAHPQAQKTLSEIEQLAKKHLAEAQALDKQDKLSDAIAILDKIPDGTQVFPPARQMRDAIESKIATRQPAPEPLPVSPRQDVEPSPEEEGGRSRSYPAPDPAPQDSPSNAPDSPAPLQHAPTEPPPAKAPSGNGSSDRNRSGEGGAGG
jgi:hypothetical protein